MTQSQDKDDKIENRKPAAFAVEPEAVHLNGPAQMSRKPASFSEHIVLTADEDDPFLNPEKDTAVAPVTVPRKRRFFFGKIALAAFGFLFSLAFGLWTDSLIRNLFARADWLGYTALAALAVGILAVLALVLRELASMSRLTAVHAIRAEADLALAETKPAKARALVQRVSQLLSQKPETARGQATLTAAKDDVIDPPQLIELAERELLGPLDRRARGLILQASKRVSVVTAISPRALVDLLYVLYESAKLVRAIADLYGGRPGTLGMIRLFKDVVAHLAVTGSIAVGDGIVQQVVGHGLASRLSARLGEGVVNGLMTARIGIAAMDLCRPLPFRALRRPGISDYIADLSPTSQSSKDEGRR
ncbi:YcjF family protein [Oryzifoliimicrobium ureilyticus]|uniref:YcjF family protein n=1 Tax=Oryzifoliimicrobium ureilyticus TaxID=3113724 RepID=UPI003075FF6B